MLFAVPGGPSLLLRFLGALAVAVDGPSAPVSPGVLASSSSVISLAGLTAAEGVFRSESGFPRTCCKEVLGSARVGEEGCVVMCSSISEAPTVEPGLGAQASVIR